MGVDGFESPTYMAASPTGQGVLPNPVCVSLSRIPWPRIKLGGGTRRLFDIVGLDEGTCGRRPRSPAASRRWMIGYTQALPWTDCAGLAPAIGSTCLVTYPQYM